MTYVVAAIGLLDGALRQRLYVRLPVPLLLFVALAATSVLWTEGPDLTTRRSVGLAGTVVVGLFLAQRLRPSELLEVLRRTLTIVAVCSLLLYASGSALALDEVHGSLRGVLSTKNTLGRFMALGLLAAATTALLNPQRTRRCLLSAVPMVVALALTDSTGGTLVAVIILLCMGGAALWRARAGQVLLLSSVALALSALVVLLPLTTTATVTGLVGEDATLTGRTDIWALSVEAIGDRPLLGHGYEAFWQRSDTAERIRAREGWEVPSAHNGLLDVGLDLGVVGMLLAVLVLGSVVVKGVRDAATGYSEGAFLRLPFTALIVVSTLIEAGLLGQNLLLTIMLVVALAIPRPRPPGWIEEALLPKVSPHAPQAQP